MENCKKTRAQTQKNQHCQAFALLLHHIPNHNYVLLRKDALKRCEQHKAPSAAALEKSKWLKFNTRAIKFIIVDVDGTSMSDFVQRYALDLMRLPPTWIIATDNGIQIAYALKDTIPMRRMSPPTKKYLTAIKTALVERFGADRRATMRNTGFWRNPLTHDGRINPEFEYSLGEIAEAFGVRRDKRPQTPHIGTFQPTKGYVSGNRNNALYWRCVSEINRFPDRYTEDELGDFAVAINEAQTDPLPEREAHKTGRSAWRQYHIYGKRLKFEPKLDYKTWKRAYNAEYYKKAIGKEEIMTRQEAVAIARKALMDDRKSRVERGLMILQMEGRKVTVRALAEAAQVAKDTAAKYLRELRAQGVV